MKQEKKSKSILIIFIIIVALVLSIYQLKNSINRVDFKPEVIKEVEFINSKIVEVDTNSILNTTYASRLYRVKDSTIMINMRFSSSSILLLKSKQAIDKNNNIYLYDNIEFHRDRGFIYYTDKAVYHRSSEILNIDKRFKAIRDNDIFIGKSMEYNAKIGAVTAKNTDSIFILK
ncbi:hypothetical protein MNB_SV-15-205 [hydrothermal vent metagenome]|uniref:LPS export ABC transporter periplasmic protein LptC n=1 Tax=hydrothermal vent metagenome TaxID=652676 RepID=A0A1W1EJJ4_9ZZZZ